MLDNDHQEETPHHVWVREEQERRRRKAYSDPDTGSDRFFVEAQRKRSMGLEDEALALEQQGYARVEEIKQTYAYPKQESFDGRQ